MSFNLPGIKPGSEIKLLRKCFRELPALEQFRATGEGLLSRFSDAGKKRNDFVHAAIATLSYEDGAFTFLKVDVSEREHHSIRSVALNDSDWAPFRTELLRLGKDGQSLAQRMWCTLKERI